MLFRSELNLKSQSLRGVQGKPSRNKALIRPSAVSEYDLQQELASLYDDEDDIEGGGSLKFSQAASFGGLNRTIPKAIPDPAAHESLRQRQRCVFAFIFIALMSLGFYSFIVFNRGHHRPPPSGMYPDTTFLYFPPKPSAVPLPLPLDGITKPQSDVSSRSADLDANTNSADVRGSRGASIESESHVISKEQEIEQEGEFNELDSSDPSLSHDNLNSFLENEVDITFHTQPSSIPLHVWHLSDLHIDPFYSSLDEHVQKGKRKVCRPPTGSVLYDAATGVDVGKVADRADKACSELESMGWTWEPQADIMPNQDWPFGRPHCDPPLLTLHAALNFIEQQQRQSEYSASPTVIVVTGDVVGHKIKCPYVVSQVRRVVMREIRNRLPAAVILFVPGNNDYDTKDAPTTENHLKVTRDVEESITIPARFESDEAEYLFKTTGAYTYDVPSLNPSASPLRFIMFNSVLFSSGNVNGQTNEEADGDDQVYGRNRASQLSFLRKELERAREENVKVVLVTHSPPGAKADLLEADENLLLEIISPFAEEGRILAMLTGDLSRNEFRSVDTAADCLVAPEVTQEPKAPLTVLISGGISSRKGGAPSVRQLAFNTVADSEVALTDWTDFALKQPQKPTDKIKWVPVFNFRAVSMSHVGTANPVEVRNLLKRAFQPLPADIIYELSNIYGMYRAGGDTSLIALQLDNDRWREVGEWLLTRLQQEALSAAWTPFSASQLILSSKQMEENNVLNRMSELSNVLRGGDSQDAGVLRSSVLSFIQLAFDLDPIHPSQDANERKGDIAVAAARKIFSKMMKNVYSRRLRCASLTRSEKCFSSCKKEIRKMKGEKKILKRGFDELAVFLHEQSEQYSFMREEL